MSLAPHGMPTSLAAVAARMTTLGIIGAGNIGTAVAKAAIGIGHDVVIANSRGPETLHDLVVELGPKARAASAKDAAAAADVAVVTVPLKAYREVPVAELADKVVIDTNNYYPGRDGHIEALDQGETTTAEMLQDHLPTSRVAKGFNHIAAAQILTDGTPAGSPGRRALVTSSDHREAAQVVTDLYDAIGFDTVDISPLSDSWRIERDQPGYGPNLDRVAMSDALARATRIVG